LKKSHLSMLLSLFLATTATISGCGSKTEGTNGGNAKSDQTLTEAGAYPITKEKMTLKVLSQQLAVISDIKTNEFTKWMEEKTNIHVDWQLVPSDAVADKVNLILASGDLPDVLYGVGLNDVQEAQYGVTEKMLIPLNDLIDKYAPNFKKFVSDYESVKGVVTNTDGNIYALPGWNDCFHCSYQSKMWLNQDWMKKLGLKDPTTTDEFYNVLKAFKTQDPNGNGKQDEVPLAGSTDGWNGDVTSFLMNPFIFDPGMYETNKRFIKDGKIDTSVNKPEYKEGLKYIAKLYKEGLISQGSFTQKNDQVMQLVANPDANLLGATPNGASVAFVQSNNQERYRQYLTLSPLKGPSGKQQTPFFKYSAIANGAFAITKACKSPEAAMRWVDLSFSFEGAQRHSIGVLDKEWRMPKEGEVGINGKPALWKMLVPYNNTDPQNNSYLWLGCDNATADMRLGMEMAKDVDPLSVEGMERMLYDETANKYQPYTPKDVEVLPPIKLTTEESQEISTINVELGKFIQESKVKFIVGEMDIDAEWDNYVKNLENIGLQKYLDIYQKGYERQYKK
jgi:putative aldouronate transport system substrate-binding protein